MESSSLSMLEAMGFGRQLAEAALQSAKGDVARAAEALSDASAKAEDAARRLATGDAEAADDLLLVLTQISLNHADSRYRILPLARYGSALAAARGAGEALLKSAGFERHAPTESFSLTRFDGIKILTARAALAEAVASRAGSDAATRRRERAAALEEGRAARAAAAASFFANAAEPDGTAGVATLTFDLGAGKQRVVRRFDGDDCFEKVLRFLATRDDAPPDYDDDDDREDDREDDDDDPEKKKKTWRLLLEETPAWWCDAWTLASAGRVFEPRDTARTLNALGLWPSAIVEPKPSELMRRVETRFDGAASLEGNDRGHYNVAKSADKISGLPELLGMGFSEDKARAALRRAGGDLQRALDALLR